MAYISTSHNVGDTVYRYDIETDAVWRGNVTAIKAICTDARQYGGSGFAVSYEVMFADGMCDHSEDDLHTSALTAFNSAPPQEAPEPIPVPEVSLVPMPEEAKAGDTF